MGQLKRNPLGCGGREGAQDTTSSPYSIANIAAAEALGASAVPYNGRTPELGWREGLAQCVPKFRNQEHKTFESGRTARRKLARMLAKKGVKP